jgi:hypothetical protein
MRDESPEQHPADSDDQQQVGVSAASDRVLIRLLLRQTPEERLRGLANAARFFDKAERV